MDFSSILSKMLPRSHLQTSLVILFFGCQLLHLSSGYSESQQYLGCFEEKGLRQNKNNALRILNHEVPIPSGPITVQKCIDACRADAFTYAALQNGNTCYCGNQYFGLVAYEKCKVPCAGNATEMCGADWINSVYSTCPAGTYGLNCEGNCPQCNMTGKSHRCLLSSGVCIDDINECLDPVINTTCSGLCNNTDTGYYCTCRRGYVLKKGTFGTCKALNGIPPWAVMMVVIAILTPVSIAFNLTLKHISDTRMKNAEAKAALRDEQERRADEERGQINPAHDENSNDPVQPHLYKKLNERPPSMSNA